MSAPRDHLLNSGSPPAARQGFRILFLLILALPFFILPETASVWDSNEAFYVQTPREMLQRGEWLVPYFNDQPRLNKPPLAYWLLAVLYQALSVSILWERLLMAGLAYGSVLAVLVLGRLLLTDSAALLGAGLFATTFRLVILSRRLLIDVLLLFCLLWALVCFLNWLRSGRPRHFLLAALLTGFGFLSKGPVALLPVLIVALYLKGSRQFERLRQAPWLAGGLLFGGVASFWFLLLGWRLGWPVVADFFLQENLGRFTSLDYGPRRSAFYYVPVFFGDFFPWSLLFPAALWWSWRNLTGLAQETRRGLLLMALWIATYFLFFSASGNKQEYYILPLYAAASLWIAFYLEQTSPSRALRGGMAVLIAMVAAGWFGLAKVLFQAAFWMPLLLLPLILGTLFANRFRMMVVSVALFYAACFVQYLGPLETFKPIRKMSATLRERIALHGDTPVSIGYYRLAAPSLVFYLDRPILELSDQAETVTVLESEHPVYLIMEAGHFWELRQVTDIPLEIVEARPKIYTTARNLIQGLQGDSLDHLRSAWTHPVYLVANRHGK